MVPSSTTTPAAKARSITGCPCYGNEPRHDDVRCTNGWYVTTSNAECYANGLRSVNAHDVAAHAANDAGATSISPSNAVIFCSTCDDATNDAVANGHVAANAVAYDVAANDATASGSIILASRSAIDGRATSVSTTTTAAIRCPALVPAAGRTPSLSSATIAAVCGALSLAAAVIRPAAHATTSILAAAPVLP